MTFSDFLLNLRTVRGRKWPKKVWKASVSRTNYISSGTSVNCLHKKCGESVKYGLCDLSDRFVDLHLHVKRKQCNWLIQAYLRKGRGSKSIFVQIRHVTGRGKFPRSLALTFYGGQRLFMLPTQRTKYCWHMIQNMTPPSVWSQKQLLLYSFILLFYELLFVTTSHRITAGEECFFLGIVTLFSLFVSMGNKLVCVGTNRLENVASWCSMRYGLKSLV